MRSTTVENNGPRTLDICVMEDTCQSRWSQPTRIQRAVNRVERYIIHEHGNSFVIEKELDSARPEVEVLCGHYKLAEVWDRKSELVKESDLERLE